MKTYERATNIIFSSLFIAALTGIFTLVPAMFNTNWTFMVTFTAIVSVTSLVFAGFMTVAVLIKKVTT